MYQVLLKSEGVRPFFVITWPGITLIQVTLKCCSLLYVQLWARAYRDQTYHAADQHRKLC